MKLQQTLHVTEQPSKQYQTTVSECCVTRVWTRSAGSALLDQVGVWFTIAWFEEEVLQDLMCKDIRALPYLSHLATNRWFLLLKSGGYRYMESKECGKQCLWKAKHFVHKLNYTESPLAAGSSIQERYLIWSGHVACEVAFMGICFGALIMA